MHKASLTLRRIPKVRVYRYIVHCTLFMIFADYAAGRRGAVNSNNVSLMIWQKVIVVMTLLASNFISFEYFLTLNKKLM